MPHCSKKMALLQAYIEEEADKRAEARILARVDEEVRKRLPFVEGLSVDCFWDSNMCPARAIERVEQIKRDLEAKMLLEAEVERTRRREELWRKIQQEESDKRRVTEIMDENKRKMDEAKRKQVCV